ncbi:ribonuclease J [Candidatus Amesbacteria bacterium]|nr:ribonuclease J [Candidatus Amesbacteria bacterium]
MLKIISLGGFGNVTSNMFAYELEDEILLIDCGIGFPSEDMLGIDILIPDFSYLKDKVHKIKGLILTHGHEDHIGALPYILPQIPNVTVYASKFPAHLVMEKLAEYQNMPKTIQILNPGTPLHLGKFTITSVRISHSIPDSTNLIIQTLVGTIYHGSDFKVDFTPIDGVLPELGKIAEAGNRGVHLLLSDSLGSDKPGYTPSEKTLNSMFDREMSSCEGKFIMTTMGSNISRFGQVITAAVKHGRRIAISGRSMERNIKVALNLGYLKVPQSVFVDLKEVKKLPAKNICVLMAGAMGQVESAMGRLGLGEHRDIEVKAGDKVLFSSTPIPGTESDVENLINQLTELGAEVIHSGISSDLHVSGHPHQQELLLMMNLVKPKYLLPMGGTYQHMVSYAKLAKSMGYTADKILLPKHSQTIEVYPDIVKLGPALPIRKIMVDGLGVGDVGNVVLRDRQMLAKEGMVVAVIEVDQNDLSKITNIELISRGFVFTKEAGDLLNHGAQEVTKAVASRKDKIDSDRVVKSIAVDTLEKFFFHKTARRPMILPVVVEV